jgi:probable phosphoglycerate mutase
MAHEIWLIRHGETEWALSGAHTGRTDIPLTETGEQQALALRTTLAGMKFDLVLTSPLQRARRTCELAGFGEQAQLDSNLEEWAYGDYEGRSTEEIHRDRPGWLPFRDGFPGGETLEQVAVRARAVIERANAVSGAAAFFAHGHILRILAACWCEMDPAEGARLALGTAGVSVLGYEHETQVIVHWNRS